jgi:hypothetical protein
MDALPLPVIGWIFTIGCTVALVLGTYLTLSAQKIGGRAKQELATRLLEDLLLFSIWLLGLAGGIGVLQEKGWSRPALELFCWTLMILISISAIKRFMAMPKPRFLLGLSLAVFIAPIIGICIATILTLRSEATVKQLSHNVTDRLHIADFSRDVRDRRS